MVEGGPQRSMCWKRLPQHADVEKLWHPIGSQQGALSLEEHEIGFMDV